MYENNSTDKQSLKYGNCVPIQIYDNWSRLTDQIQFSNVYTANRQLQSLDRPMRIYHLKYIELMQIKSPKICRPWDKLSKILFVTKRLGS